MNTFITISAEILGKLHFRRMNKAVQRAIKFLKNPFIVFPLTKYSFPFYTFHKATII